MEGNINMNSDTHVAIILPSLIPLGGAEKVAITRAHEMRSLGYKVDIILVNETGKTSDVMEFIPPGCRLFNLRVPRFIHSIKPISSYLKAEKPTVTHAIMWPLTSIAVIAKIVSMSSTRLIVSEDTPLSISRSANGLKNYLSLKFSTFFTHRISNVVFTVSKGVAKDLSHITKIPLDKINVIHNTIILPQLSSSKHSDIEQLWKKDASRIITVGNLKSEKNHLMLVRAFKQVLEKKDAQLMILGQGDLESDIKALISNLNLGNKIIMPGHVSNVVDYYNSADLFVLSSNYEGFGNVIVEAMSCGLPVVSTDCPYGPSEILDGGKYGKLVPVGDEHAMADAMIKTLDEVADHEALKARAEKLSGSESLDAYIKLFTE